MSERIEVKPWPGLSAGGCPECGVRSDGWDMEYHVARIDWLGENVMVVPVAEKLVALTCPSCKTKFKVADYLD